MKNFLLPLMLCLLFTATINAQSIQLIDQGTTIVNGSYLYVMGNASSQDINRGLWVRNVSGQSLTLRVRRIEMDVVPNTLNATCWDICPAADTAGVYPVLTSSTMVVLADSAYDYSFSAHIYPEGQSGCSHFRYIFTEENLGDMDSIDIYFKHGVVCSAVESVGSIQDKAMAFDLFPNPANDKINLVFTNENPIDGELVISNMLGSVVQRKQFSNLAGNLELPLVDLNNGMYFISVVSDRRTLFTQKFQVLK